MYAVVETGGKQYRVKVGDTINVEKLDAEAGDEVTLDRVLLVGNDGEITIGRPVVEGASVVASVDGQTKGDKIRIFKMRAKKRYRKTIGHRQKLTTITVKDIVVA